MDANLGYALNADYGHETLGLGFSGGSSEISLKNQTVAVFAAANPLYTYVLKSNQIMKSMLTIPVESSAWVPNLSTTVQLETSQAALHFLPPCGRMNSSQA